MEIHWKIMTRGKKKIFSKPLQNLTKNEVKRAVKGRTVPQSILLAIKNDEKRQKIMGFGSKMESLKQSMKNNA